MNFSTHIRNIRNDIRLAVVKDKIQALSELRQSTQKAKDLLKTNKFDFWLRQFSIVPISEIPMTYYGLQCCKHSLQVMYQQNTRIALEGEIGQTCLRLLTYMQDSDDCPMQSDYHYYVDERTGYLIKESDLGHLKTLRKLFEPIEDGELRIAKISELEIEVSELII